MSFSLNLPKSGRFTRTSPATAVFIVEALLLLAFLAGGVAIFVRLFSLGATQAAAGERLAHAVSVAQSTAERFAADPYDIETMIYDGDLAVSVVADDEPYGEGTLHHATIYVYAADMAAAAADGSAGPEGQAAYGEPLYTLETAVYWGVGA